MLKEGITLTLEKVVKAEETAAKVASGALEAVSYTHLTLPTNSRV